MIQRLKARLHSVNRFCSLPLRPLAAPQAVLVWEVVLGAREQVVRLPALPDAAG